MSIIPNAGTSELTSPFFKKNKESCEKFLKFIEGLGGKVNGRYNAFSYHLLGKIKRKNQWDLRFKKSSYTSGNLFLSSKYQSLSFVSEWFADEIELNCPKFKIRKKKKLDYIKKYIFSNLRELKENKNYILECSESNNFFILYLNEILLNLYIEEKVYEIIYEKKKMVISLRTEEIHREEILKIIEI
ncbi:MAG: hypothetical protein QM486_05795 [Flavobacteriaceae bacterium]